MQLKSWALWQALAQYPLRYELVAYQANLIPTSRRSAPTGQTAAIGLIVIGAIMLLCCLITFFGVSFAAVTLLGYVAVFGLLMALSVAPGLNLAFKVSRIVAKAHADQRYDLMATAPYGALGLHWTLVLRCWRHDATARRLRDLAALGGAAVLPLVGVFVPLLVLSFITVIFNTENQWSFVVLQCLPLILLGGIYTDYVQSLVLATLLCMLTPNWVTTSTLGWMTALIFVGGKALLYLSLVLLHAILQAQWASGDAQSDGTALLMTVIGWVVGSALLQEAIIYGLWQMAARTFGDDLTQLRLT
ncbi:MAG: hypothetical protein H7Y11_01155 [Armatimonadetes bacterium]|nr:hypothetical protein [Anaerolineae bacterium]